MSRRHEKNDLAEHGFRLLAAFLQNSSPRTLAIGAALLVVLGIAGVLWWSSQGGQLLPGPDPERQPPIATPADGAWYELHFTSPAYPTNKTNYHGGLDERLVGLMKRAERTLDVAVYDFDLDNVAEAMAAAKRRGVTVRLVTDSDTVANQRTPEIQAALDKLRAAEIPIVTDERSAIMHHKFTIVDREWVQTGSWNYTTGDTYRLNNHLFLVRSRELAENYTAEFEKMFVHGRFGPKKARGVAHEEVTISGSRVRNFFAPQDRVADKILATLQEARESIYFLAFSFTHNGIGDAILAKAREGLKVGGVFETTGSNTPASQYGKMKQAGLDVYTDGNPYVMHHKVIVLDGRTVIFGSFNFSSNADKANDENVLIVEDAGLARAFLEEYERVLALAKDPPKRR